MRTEIDPSRAKRRVAVDAAMLLIIILLMTQMWLLTATLESYLAGHHSLALPCMLVSAVLALACLALYRLVVRLDRSHAQKREGPAFGPWKIG